MKKLISLAVFLSLFSVIFHFHADFSYHSDCPACVFEVDDEKTLTLNVKSKETPTTYSDNYRFVIKLSLKKNFYPKPSFPRAPPVKTLL